MFGALISPTDPVAVVAVLKRAGVPKSLETRIGGESLFNDGTGVVAFITLLGVASSPDSFDPPYAAAVPREVLGGLAFGLGVGYAGFLLLRAVDSYAVEIMITLALATAGYAAAEALSVSAPIAVAAWVCWSATAPRKKRCPTRRASGCSASGACSMNC